MEKISYTQFGLLGLFFRWSDAHKTATNILLALEALAALLAALTYNFTTNF